jgi:hypothetical protein
MDPNATWQAYLEALAECSMHHNTTKEDFDAQTRAYEHRQSLREWLLRGGFEPDWTTNEKLLFLWQSF